MPVKIEKLERVFLFNGVKLPDPSPDFTVEQVRDTYANSYPELATAAIEGPTGKDSAESVALRTARQGPAGPAVKLSE